MPKLIDYPRTTYAGAWELAEITDDTGGKCAIETAAKKLNRKVSGSFKAIIGSAVKFGLVVSKRELLTTTTLFKRIKHAYDKQEELLFHREAFLTPPLFTQLCRKFRSRELPVQMLDVMLIREFGVEEINAQGVAKSFVEGARMVGVLNEHNVIIDVDASGTKQSPRRELANQLPAVNNFRNTKDSNEINVSESFTSEENTRPKNRTNQDLEFDLTMTPKPTSRPVADPTSRVHNKDTDAVINLFGLNGSTAEAAPLTQPVYNKQPVAQAGNPFTQTDTTIEPIPTRKNTKELYGPISTTTTQNKKSIYQIEISGPGVNTTLSIIEEEDIVLAIALLEKIRRQLLR